MDPGGGTDRQTDTRTNRIFNQNKFLLINIKAPPAEAENTNWGGPPRGCAAGGAFRGDAAAPHVTQLSILGDAAAPHFGPFLCSPASAGEHSPQIGPFLDHFWADVLPKQLQTGVTFWSRGGTDERTNERTNERTDKQDRNFEPNRINFEPNSEF